MYCSNSTMFHVEAQYRNTVGSRYAKTLSGYIRNQRIHSLQQQNPLRFRMAEKFTADYPHFRTVYLMWNNQFFLSSRQQRAKQLSVFLHILWRIATEAITVERSIFPCTIPTMTSCGETKNAGVRSHQTILQHSFIV
jgi:hypothetical protein